MGDFSYFASQSFGLYRCANWEYGSSTPTWEHIGQTMAINEFSLDLNDPDEFQAMRSGSSIYVRRPTHYGHDNWVEVYSITQAEAQFGESLDDFKWVEINSAPGKEGHMYTQCLEEYNAQGKDLWLMTSANYGISWSRSLIINGIIRAPGGIWAGRVTGDIMYSSYAGHGITVGAKVRYSINEGGTWAQKSNLAGSLWVGRVMIDPTDENKSYAGTGVNGPSFRGATPVGANYVLYHKDNAGIAIFYGFGGGWVSAEDSDYVRTIRDNVLYFTDDACQTWGENNVDGIGYHATFERAMWGRDKKPWQVGVASRTDIDEPTDNYHLLKSTLNNGGTWYDKAGANANTADTGGGDSIPYNCGGVAENGVYLIIPGRVFTSVVAMRALPTAGTVYADGVQMGALPTGGTVYAHGVEQESPRQT